MNFDEKIERTGTRSEKWDGLGQVFGAPEALALWVADMDFSSPPAVTEALVHRAGHPVYGYTLWEESYYDAARDWYRRRQGWSFPREAVLSSAGVVNGLSMALRALTEPGDPVVIQPPVYGPFYSIPRLNDRPLRENTLRETPRGWTVDFEDLDRQLDGAKVLMLCSPHNPVGRVWTREELEETIRLCQRHNVLVFADEIHSDLVFAGHRHLPLATLSAEAADRVVTFVAPSKTFNLAGLSTALMVVTNEDLRDRIREELARTGMHMGNTFGIEGLEAAYRDGEPWLEELLTYLEESADMVLKTLEERLPGIRARKPEGTYLLWMDFRSLGISQGELIRWVVRDCGLALSSGTFFGDGGEGFLRMNLACPRPMLREALARLEHGMEERGWK